MKTFTPILLIMLTVQFLSAQDSKTMVTDKPLNYEPRLSGELFTLQDRVNEITYFNKDWLPGIVYLSNGEIVKNSLIRYNGLLDELFWWEPKSENTIKLDKASILRFHFLNFQGDTSIYFRKIKVKKDMILDTSELFAQEIYLGGLSLLVSHDFAVIRRELVYKDGIPYQKAIYEEEPVYYFSYSDNETIGLKSLSRKSLIAAFPDKKDPIRKFMRDNRLGASWDLAELVRLARMLNSLPAGQK